MRIKDVMQMLNEWAPLTYSEDFDNTGLLVGDASNDVTGVLVTLDCLESVLEEALQTGCNLIVSFHPIIFGGLKKITGKTYVERVVQKAIKNDIAIFAIHTALDNAWDGVNSQMLQTLGAKKQQVLIPQKGSLKKLTTFAPKHEAQDILTALFDAGAGAMGDYSECSFTIDGMGTFTPDPNANPSLGKIGVRHHESETKIDVVFARDKESQIVKALLNKHSYEEVAYEIYTIENTNSRLGMGMVGSFDKPMQPKAFLEHLQTKMNAKGIRHSALGKKPIKTIAVLGGSGSFGIGAAMAKGVDAYVSADFKYHDFFKAEGQILLVDIGHYESEQYTKNLIVTYLQKKITNFAPAFPQGKVLLSQIDTNPIIYL
ncbi:MAG: Nif3-like dinuclear metal center hexameric protein [Gilvibacter sp.]